MTTYLQTPRAPTPTAIAKPKWYRRTWAIVSASVFLGLVLGSAAVAGTTDPTTSTQYKGVVKQRDEVRQQLEQTSAELEAAESDLATTELDLEAAEDEIVSIQGDLPAREQALEKAEAKLERAQRALGRRADAVTAKEKSVVKRERAVGIVERRIEANTISGDGVYEVGVDIRAGTYKSAGANGMCYYASNGDANGSNILSNNIVEGGAPAVTTVAAGTFFETSGCGDWVLQ